MTPHSAGVRGTFDPRFRPVAVAFAGTVTEPESGGAALSIWHRGTEVVNLQCGVADARYGRPWDERTPAVLFSATKGLASLVVARLAEQGRIDLEAPVARVWPEFGVHGKEALTIGDLLAHRAGLIAPDADIGLDEALDGRRIAARLAAQKPRWEPGKAHLYHAMTWGPLVRETVLRATGEDLPELFQEFVAAPLGAEATLQATDAEVARVAHITTSPAFDALSAHQEQTLDEDARRFWTCGGAFPMSLVTADGGFNDPRVLKAGLASGGGLGTASALARIWSAAVTPTLGHRVLSDHGIGLLTRERSSGPSATDADGAPGPFLRWGAGAQLSSEAQPWLSAGSFGHDGAGGQSAFADPRHRIGFGYLTNRMEPAPSVPQVISALRTVLEAG
ncbi:serine hydrolase domain-containing protein [Actinomadura bangladeshensis]|jgi:CubicO group peptidase (beta-lactamase class C family)|uniref:Beta-lactamase family protein n=1 Tax=Actinomadura bangladeshensis TaxID=453573 RepID=A0A6L9QSL4_9ACTN|nr:serine hydrolase domain-containing protein [Actinomadura bangladeshensis]NEA28489.1 beta-lactamase family protein [Actinomadura bangladeshensis]